MMNTILLTLTVVVPLWGPVEAPSQAPASEPASGPTSKPSSQPTPDAASRPTSEPTSRPTSAPASQPASQPASEPTSEPTSQPASEPTSRPTSEPTSEPTAEPTAEPAVLIPLWGLEVIPAPATPFEEKIIARALKCVRMRERADPVFLLRLLRIEEEYDVPRPLRGMVLAAACSESGFNPQAQGDYRRGIGKRRKPKAIGILQQWPWFERAYQFNRRDPIAAARAWLKHITTQFKPVRRRCGKRLKGEKLWVKAWVHAVRAPKPGGRCDETPKHYIRLKRWRKAWRR